LATLAGGAATVVGSGDFVLAAGLLVVDGEIGHVLVGQAAGDRAHRRMLALALAVGGERGGDVLAALAGDLRHLVDLGKARLVALDAVAAVAHRRLLLAGDGVAGLRVLRARSGGNATERKGDDDVREGRQRRLLLHGAGVVGASAQNGEL
jgi:hypothetical protein